MCMMNINKCSYGTGDFPTSHFTAEEHCAAAGARLCTSEELQNDESHGSGCNYDFQWWVNGVVWLQHDFNDAHLMICFHRFT